MQKKGRPEVSAGNVIDAEVVDLRTLDARAHTVVAQVRVAAAPAFLFELELVTTTRPPEVRAFNVRATGDASVTASVIRLAPLGALERLVRAEVRRRAQQSLGNDEALSTFEVLGMIEGEPARRKRRAERMDLAQKLVADFSFDSGRPGRRGRDDAAYARAAALYVELLGRGEPHPVRRMSEQLNLSESTIRHLLNTARNRDLLTKAPAGGAGGELTQKAIATLLEPSEEVR